VTRDAERRPQGDGEHRAMGDVLGRSPIRVSSVLVWGPAGW
jgi:hypothetical protein